MSTAVLGPSDTTVEKPTAFFLAQSRMDDGQRARLRHQRQRPQRGQLTGHTGVELQVRPLKTQAVGAQQVDAVAGGHFVQIGRQCGVDAAGDHQGRTAFDAPGNFQSGGDLGGRQRNDGQIGIDRGQIGQGATGMNVQKNQSAGKALGRDGLVQHTGLRGECLGFFRLACKHHNRGR